MIVSVKTQNLWDFLLSVIESSKTSEHIESCNNWLLDLKKKKVIDYLQWKDLNHLNQVQEEMITPR